VLVLDWELRRRGWNRLEGRFRVGRRVLILGLRVRLRHLGCQGQSWDRVEGVFRHRVGRRRRRREQLARGSVGRLLHPSLTHLS
jgi:hypothetical protein